MYTANANKKILVAFRMHSSTTNYVHGSDGIHSLWEITVSGLSIVQGHESQRLFVFGVPFTNSRSLAHITSRL
jgi:hypothetical protein